MKHLLFIVALLLSSYPNEAYSSFSPQTIVTDYGGTNQAAVNSSHELAAVLASDSNVCQETGGNLAAILTALGTPMKSTGGTVGLVAGTAVIGHVIVDTAPTTAVTGTFWQTTQPVSIATAPVLVAGSAIIGKVGIDQTTPGTTNKVTLGSDVVQTKAPLSVTGSGTTGTVSTVITLTAPSNAVGFVLESLDTSTANIRWALGRTATTTVGSQLQPGRDTGFIPFGGNVSIVSESGTQNYDVNWVSQ